MVEVTAGCNSSVKICFFFSCNGWLNEIDCVVLILNFKGVAQNF